MAKAKRFLSANLFNQITLFSMGGLSMSMAMVFAYDLRIESWM
jgi:hypothetical protein